VNASLAALRTGSRLVEALVLTIAARIGDRHKGNKGAASGILCDVAIQDGAAEGLLPAYGHRHRSHHEAQGSRSVRDHYCLWPRPIR
jgi:hypothetical protein